MHRRMLFAVLFLAGCVSTAPPSAVVEDFYTAYIANRPAGLPEGAALDHLRPFLSARLETLIDDALAFQKEFIRTHPADEKPPFVDGDHFTSLFEGPASFKVLGAERTNVRVRFRLENTEWEDVVVVTRENGRYVIDDIVFGGAGEFNPGGRLSETLRSRAEKRPP